jgi:pterin-4a-carbinolamine dehydratase
MPTLTTVWELKFGDRFYYASDKKKIVWQVNSAYAKIVKHKGFKNWMRAMERVNELGKVLEKKDSRTNTAVYFLRNILDNATTTI